MALYWWIALIPIGLAICWVTVAIALLPLQVKLQWRKLWQGAIAFKLKICITGLAWEMVLNRRSPPIGWLSDWVWGGSLSPLATLRQSQRKLAFIKAISPAIVVSTWAIDVELGFDDPTLTGECLGLLSAMPSAVQRSIGLTFARSGLRSRGCICFSVWAFALLWNIGLWWWTHPRTGGRNRDRL